MPHLNLNILGSIAEVSFVVFQKHPSNVHLVIIINMERSLGLSSAKKFRVLGKTYSQILKFSKI